MREEVNRRAEKHPVREAIGASDRCGERAVRLIVLCEMIEEANDKLWRKGSLLSTDTLETRVLALNSELLTCSLRYGETARNLASIGSDWLEAKAREARAKKGKKTRD
jgi:hypothetical protein